MHHSAPAQWRAEKPRLRSLGKKKMAAEAGKNPSDTRAELAELLKHKEELAV